MAGIPERGLARSFTGKGINTEVLDEAVALLEQIQHLVLPFSPPLDARLKVGNLWKLIPSTLV